MRHFLAASQSPGPLPRGVVACPAGGPLVAGPGPPHTLPPLGRGARPRAVEVAVIAAPADADLPMAARAVVETVPPHRGPARRGTGQRSRVAA